jgi:DNA-directed RNA polymerase subunit RPC12/RpoP
MKASFEYKCRRCGKINLNPHCNKDLALTESIKVINGIQSELPQAPTLMSLHLCKDGGTGISDLQGFRVTERPEDAYKP